MSEEKYTIVSFSGGKDSTAMLLHMIEIGEHIDEVINVDTGMEFPEMYDHISMVHKILEKNNIPMITLKNEHSFEWFMLEKPVKSDKYGDHYGWGWPSINSRWCTRHLKLELINKYLKKKNEDNNIIQCVGLAADETKRLEKPNNMKNGQRHPLVEWGWTEADCLNYCKSKGFTWGGLYDIFKRVSCWCCPLSSIPELRKLWIHYPELWAQLEKWETALEAPNVGKRGAYKFKDEISVFDLGKKFEREVYNTKCQQHLEAYL